MGSQSVGQTYRLNNSDNTLSYTNIYSGKDWRQEEKGIAEDEMVGWHHWLNGHEFEKTLGESEVQGGLVSCSLWGLKESDTTEWLRTGEERGDRGWDGWIASLTQWTWVWANSKRCRRTRKPGVLQSMGSQRVRNDLGIEQQQQNVTTNAFLFY